MTDADFSEKLGVPTETFRCWQSGKRIPKAAQLTDIATKLGIWFGVNIPEEIVQKNKKKMFDELIKENKYLLAQKIIPERKGNK